MRLAGGDGSTLALRPLRYQFPGAHTRDAGGQWDANWLVVAGEVSTPDGAWSFTDPCLTTWEARTLGAWLRAVARCPARPEGGAGGDPPPEVDFTEPVLAFGRSGDDGRGTVGLRVRLTLEALPPWQARGEYVLTLRLPAGALLQAADEWEHDLAPFPER
jgi:hypothetical protein